MNNIGFRRTHMCAELNEANAGELVNLSGWVQRTRNLGSIIFVWLRDRTGLVQLVFDEKDCDKETFALGESLRGEYVLSVQGKVSLRDEAAVNEKLKTGRIEVFVRKAILLNKAETPPIYIDDDHPDESETVRMKYRYLDIRRPSVQRTLRMRHKILQTLRNYMDGEEFVEVETAILTKSTPEGARDCLVPSAAEPADLQAAAHARRVRPLFPDRPLLPRRGQPRRPPAGVHPVRHRDELCRAGGRADRGRGRV